jgi:hypothetical protein
LLSGKRALLLDMNNTFMFGENRFGDAEDFSAEEQRVLRLFQEYAQHSATG